MGEVAIILASAGRPALLGEVLGYCRAQQGIRFQGVVSVPDAASLPDDASLFEGWRVVTGTRGAAAQRNAGLEALDGPVDVVFFFDDDAVVRSDYVARAVAFLGEHPEVVGLTGRVLLDGKLTGEIPRERAAAEIAASAVAVPSGEWARTRELYGANFAVRFGRLPVLRFDDQLPLYSWLEDHDMARRLLPHGTLAYVADCVIVHRAAASGGRASHVRLGYSQVMNAVYLARKGSFPLWLAAQQIARPLAKNVLYAGVRTAATPWRRARLRGNALAMADVARGRITPERIHDLSA